MGAATIEVADGVLFKVEAIDDERRRRLRLGGGLFLVFVLVFVCDGFEILRLGVAENEYKTRAVRGPFEIVNALSCFCEALRFPTAAIEEPHLVFASVASREEGEEFAIRAPAGMRRGKAFGSQGNGIAAAGG